MFVEEGEIGGAEADVFEKIQQPHQRICRVVLLCRRLYEQRHNGVKARLGVCGKAAVFMSVADLFEPCGDGFGIEPVFFQTSIAVLLRRVFPAMPIAIRYCFALVLQVRSKFR